MNGGRIVGLAVVGNTLLLTSVSPRIPWLRFAFRRNLQWEAEWRYGRFHQLERDRYNWRAMFKLMDLENDSSVSGNILAIDACDESLAQIGL
ncbi:hypothetical protein RRG08_017511 [Elysia crispata]|uniref:Uncharacterized protein n=1 Tax=Elysia crispata TaxID=231223 RepID=A0AAE0ZB55_9GAST|nr:hypothetical protein RRG08_017511 [Elysia crispata]